MLKKYERLESVVSTSDILNAGIRSFEKLMVRT